MTYSGQHVGPFLGFEPTGLRVQWVGTALFRLERDKIADLWVLGDVHGVENQLGSNQRQHSST